MQQFHGHIEQLSTDPNDELKYHWLLNFLLVEMRNYVFQFELTLVNQVEVYDRRYVDLVSQSNKSRSKKNRDSISDSVSHARSTMINFDKDRYDNDDDDLLHGKMDLKKAHHKRKQ